MKQVDAVDCRSALTSTESLVRLVEEEVKRSSWTKCLIPSLITESEQREIQTSRNVVSMWSVLNYKTHQEVSGPAAVFPPADPPRDRRTEPTGTLMMKRLSLND